MSVHTATINMSRTRSARKGVSAVAMAASRLRSSHVSSADFLLFSLFNSSTEIFSNLYHVIGYNNFEISPIERKNNSSIIISKYFKRENVKKCVVPCVWFFHGFKLSVRRSGVVEFVSWQPRVALYGG